MHSGSLFRTIENIEVNPIVSWIWEMLWCIGWSIFVWIFLIMETKLQPCSSVSIRQQTGLLHKIFFWKVIISFTVYAKSFNLYHPLQACWFGNTKNKTEWGTKWILEKSQYTGYQCKLGLSNSKKTVKKLPQ